MRSWNRMPLAAAMCLIGLTLAAEPERKAFEVASVKANTSDSRVESIRIQKGNRVVISNVPLGTIIIAAFNRNSMTVKGLPDWAARERFDIEGTTLKESGADELREMLQDLLSTRFRLAFHVEQTKTPAWALRTLRDGNRLGPKLHRVEMDCAAITAAAEAGTRNPCGIRRDLGVIAGKGYSMDNLAGFLRGEAGRVVLNQTGLAGPFEFELTYLPQAMALNREATRVRMPSIDVDAPSVFEAVKEQLGLQLVADTAVEDVLVVDQLERPSVN